MALVTQKYTAQFKECSQKDGIKIISKVALSLLLDCIAVAEGFSVYAYSRLVKSKLEHSKIELMLKLGYLTLSMLFLKKT